MGRSSVRPYPVRSPFFSVRFSIHPFSLHTFRVSFGYGPCVRNLVLPLTCIPLPTRPYLFLPIHRILLSSPIFLSSSFPLDPRCPKPFSALFPIRLGSQSGGLICFFMGLIFTPNYNWVVILSSETSSHLKTLYRFVRPIRSFVLRYCTVGTIFLKRGG